MIQKHAYPLDWPEAQPVTHASLRKTARFKLSFAKAREDVLNQLRMLGCGDWNVIMSTNIELRRDGLPYAGRTPHGSPGVAVYFKIDGEQSVFACDCWQRAEDNMRAIGKTIEALRGISRWGSGEMLKRAFQGFKALPAPPENWRAVFGFDDFIVVDMPLLKKRYRELAREFHPDRGGSDVQLTRVNLAYELAQQQVA